LQAALLLRHAPDFVASAFCASRLSAVGHHQYGTLPRSVNAVNAAMIIQRAMPG